MGVARSRHQAINSQAMHTVGVLALTLVLRLMVACHAISCFHAPWFFARGNEMGYIAASLLGGHGFAGPFGQDTGPTAIIAPGYPLLVAAVFRLFGIYTPLSACFLISFNMFLNVLSTWMILALARQMATERAAVCSGLFWATSPPLLWMPTIFWETSFSCVLLMAPILLIYSRLKQKRSLPWVWLGGIIGGALLVNPALGPSLIVLVLVARALGHYPIRNVVLSFVTAAVIYAPWPVRNWKVFHAWIPTRSTVGLELWMGNHLGSDGFLDESLFPTYNRSELAEYRSRGEVLYMSEKVRAAEGSIRNDPGDFLLLSAKRLVRFWFGGGTLRGSIWYCSEATITTCLALWGLSALFYSEEKWRGYLLLVPLTLFPIPYCITHAEFRYRLVLEPLLIAISAPALNSIEEALAERRRNRREHDTDAAESLDYV